MVEVEGDTLTTLTTTAANFESILSLFQKTISIVIIIYVARVKPHVR